MELKKFRNKNKLTQHEVADKLGCADGTYVRYENGTREPSIDILISLADIFNVTVDEILEREPMLSDYEIQLLNAARNSDERAREDALQMLLAHTQPSKKEELA